MLVLDKENSLVHLFLFEGAKAQKQSGKESSPGAQGAAHALEVAAQFPTFLSIFGGGVPCPFLACWCVLVFF